MVCRKEIVNYLNKLFEEVNYNDISYNGLQFEGKEEVKKIVAGVDATSEFFEECKKRGADFAFVHHGVFWKGQEWKGIDRFNLKILRPYFESNLNLFAMHLPLDCHPEIGHNALICKALEARYAKPFSYHMGNPIGCIGEYDKPISIEDFKKKVEKVIGKISVHLNFGKPMIKTVGIVSGGGWTAFHDKACADGEVDVILSGEMLHQGYGAYKDREMHMIAAGHYATETFGCKAVGEMLAKEFGLEYEFIDLPTGL